MVTIHIIEIEAGLEVHALRYGAEYWGAFVTVTWVANSSQIVNFFQSLPRQDIIIICGHGNDRGLLLPELAGEIKDKYPYKDVIRPEDFKEFVRLEGNIIINSSCLGGSQKLAKIFLNRGAKYYIGANSYLDGNACLMYLLSFLYEYMRNGNNVEQAHYISSKHEDDRRSFLLFS